MSSKKLTTFSRKFVPVKARKLLVRIYEAKALWVARHEALRVSIGNSGRTGFMLIR